MSWLELVFKRYLWIIHITWVGISSAFLGKTIAHLVEAQYLISDPVAQRRTPPRPGPPPRDKDTARILDRNIMCSRCASPHEQHEEQARQAAAAEAPPKSALPLALGAVVLASDDLLSLAVIRDTSKPRPPAGWFHRGEAVFATNATVARIVERRVYLQVGDKTEFLDLNEPMPVPRAGQAAVPAPIAGKPDALSAEIDRGVRCGGNACEIDRSLVEHLLSNTTALASAARFVPAIQNGKADGFRVYAIRRASLFEKLGMQNGDRIVSINGLPMSTPDQALDLYTKLRRASHLSMQLDRKGSTTTLDYMIR